MPFWTNIQKISSPSQLQRHTHENLYTGPQSRPPNTGYLKLHWYLLPCFQFGFLLEACQIGEPHWYPLVFLARLGRFCSLGIEVEKQGFRTACLIAGQKFQGVGLKLTAVILTFRGPSSHLCDSQKLMRMAV